MKRNSSLPGARFCGMASRGSIFALAVLMAGCAATPPAVPPAAPPVTASEDAGPLPTLAYYQMLQRMTPAQVNRERMVLAALPPTPNTQLRTAMVLGHPRGQQDFTKALALLEGVLKSTDPGSVSLHPLARLLADNYSERQKLETQLEKQGQQLKDSQRKTVELQEKIDELADIERTLPQRPRATRPAGGTR
ncbi:MAG: permease [Azonexus sp.]